LPASLHYKDLECLEAALRAYPYETWLPWRGMFARAKQLCRRGLLRVSGSAAMPPYVTYIITPEEMKAVDKSRELVSTTNIPNKG
jgi:hypothetical protein